LDDAGHVRNAALDDVWHVRNAWVWHDVVG
jgi:hypothetical protein